MLDHNTSLFSCKFKVRTNDTGKYNFRLRRPLASDSEGRQLRLSRRSGTGRVLAPPEDCASSRF